MVSQKPHGTIEYTVSIAVWFVPVWVLKVELLRPTGSQWHKAQSSEYWLQFVLISIRIAPNIVVWGELGSHPEPLFNPGLLPLLTADSSIFTSPLWLFSRESVLLF